MLTFRDRAQMMTFQSTFRAFLHDESGQDMIEYGLVVGLMALGAIVGLKGLASTIANVFNAAGSTLASSV